MAGIEKGPPANVADRALFEADALSCIDTVYRAALSLCADPSLADDLVQSTYLKAWERFDQFQAGSNCRAWLMTILHNTWIDHVRHRGQVKWSAGDAIEQVAARAENADPPAANEVAKLVEQFDDPELAAAFLALPEDFRLALALVDIEDYSHDEAAAILGVPTGTVKSRTSRARRMIQDRLARRRQEAKIGVAGEEAAKASHDELP
ncbi:MAG: sigma-70 family RNA polymerase sigma factor [Phycisphaerae bacterium]|nr:sigma-70 family RNA polymerase sigma factor [Phycisphaerae bacterium]